MVVERAMVMTMVIVTAQVVDMPMAGQWLGFTPANSFSANHRFLSVGVSIL